MFSKLGLARKLEARKFWLGSGRVGPAREPGRAQLELDTALWVRKLLISAANLEYVYSFMLAFYVNLTVNIIKLWGLITLITQSSLFLKKFTVP